MRVEITTGTALEGGPSQEREAGSLQVRIALPMLKQAPAAGGREVLKDSKKFLSGLYRV